LLARWAYGRAARIIVISEGFKENLVRKGVPSRKIQIVQNWVDIDHYKPYDKDPELRTRLGISGDFVVIFGGGIGRAQGLWSLIEAAELLQGRSRVQFVIAGDGVELPSIKRLSKEKRLSNILFLGQYPETEMPRLLAQADALFVHLRDDPLFRITVPHKIFGYMACGKPILVAMYGDARKVVLEAKAGISCEPENPISIAHAVTQLMRMSEAERQTMGTNGRIAAELLYSREVLVNRIAEVLKDSVQ
jgi:colanic acid biosynthesis glycosyl transferase WcaI